MNTLICLYLNLIMPYIFNKKHFQNKWQVTHDWLITSDFYKPTSSYLYLLFSVVTPYTMSLRFSMCAWTPSKSLKDPSISVAQNAVQWEKSDNLSPSIMQNCLDTLTLQIHYKDWLLSVQKPCWPTQLCCYFAENQQLRNRQHYTLW
jgi:hypothetical protein